MLHQKESMRVADLAEEQLDAGKHDDGLEHQEPLAVVVKRLEQVLQQLSTTSLISTLQSVPEQRLARMEVTDDYSMQVRA